MQRGLAAGRGQPRLVQREASPSMNESLEDVPLRDLCKEAERITRELVDHLERHLIPRTQELHELVRPESPFARSGQHIEDITVRNSVSALLESQSFSEELFEKANQYFNAIDRSLLQIAGGDE